jgi:hypothetical protein
MLAFLGILPLQIAVAPKDSAVTNFRISGGYGQYAQILRGCEGVVDKEKIPFSEIGISIDHKTGSCFRLGLHATEIWTKKESANHQYDRPVEIMALNPFINAEWKNFAIGGGYLWASKSLLNLDDDSEEHRPSVYFRVGNTKTVYVDASYLQTTPVYSGSLFRAGLGSHKSPGFGWWFGVGYGPYDKGGLMVKTDLRLQRNLYLDALLRLGGSEGISENAVGLGLTYKWIRRR